MTTVHYWGGVKSRGQPIYWVLAYFGQIDNVQKKQDQGYPGTPEFAEMKDKSVHGQLPFLTDETQELRMGQSMAIINYLCKKFGIGESASLKDYGLSQENMQHGYEIHSILGAAHYAPNRTEAMDAIFADGGKLNKFLSNLDGNISESGWFGSEAQPGDAAVASYLDIINGLEAGYVDKFPKLAALLSKVLENEQVQAYNGTCPYAYFKRNSD